jgi:flagellar hook assembly protein FlgD
VEGRAVKTLVNQVMEPGQHQVYWDGTNDHGQLVSTGMYFCRMGAKDFCATRKMILLK